MGCEPGEILDTVMQQCIAARPAEGPPINQAMTSTAATETFITDSMYLTKNLISGLMRSTTSDYGSNTSQRSVFSPGLLVAAIVASLVLGCVFLILLKIALPYVRCLKCVTCDIRDCENNLPANEIQNGEKGGE